MHINKFNPAFESYRDGSVADRYSALYVGLPWKKTLQLFFLRINSWLFCFMVFLCVFIILYLSIGVYNTKLCPDFSHGQFSATKLPICGLLMSMASLNLLYLLIMLPYRCYREKVLPGYHSCSTKDCQSVAGITVRIAFFVLWVACLLVIGVHWRYDLIHHHYVLPSEFQASMAMLDHRNMSMDELEVIVHHKMHVVILSSLMASLWLLILLFQLKYVRPVKMLFRHSLQMCKKLVQSKRLSVVNFDYYNYNISFYEESNDSAQLDDPAELSVRAQVSVQVKELFLADQKDAPVIDCYTTSLTDCKYV